MFSLCFKQLVAEKSDSPTLHAKIALLTLHFPKLRLIWSSSPRASVEIFIDLKRNHPDPEIDVAIRIGSDQFLLLDNAQQSAPLSRTSNESQSNSSYCNPLLGEMLLACPGMASIPLARVFQRCSNFLDLSKVSKEDILEMMKKQSMANQLHQFLHQRISECPNLTPPASAQSASR